MKKYTVSLSELNEKNQNILNQTYKKDRINNEKIVQISGNYVVEVKQNNLHSHILEGIYFSDKDRLLQKADIWKALIKENMMISVHFDEYILEEDYEFDKLFTEINMKLSKRNHLINLKDKCSELEEVNNELIKLIEEYRKTYLDIDDNFKYSYEIKSWFIRVKDNEGFYYTIDLPENLFMLNAVSKQLLEDFTLMESLFKLFVSVINPYEVFLDESKQIPLKEIELVLHDKDSYADKLQTIISVLDIEDIAKKTHLSVAEILTVLDSSVTELNNYKGLIVEKV